MNSRETVIAAFKFEYPERMPLNLKDGVHDDTVWGGVRTPAGFDGSWKDPEEFLGRYPQLRGFGGQVRLDEYGSLWGRLPGDFGSGEVLYGAITDWEQMKNYDLPDLADPVRTSGMRQAFEAEPDKFAMAGLPGFPFAIMRYIRKMEYFLEDLLLEPENVTELRDKVTDGLLGMIDNMAEQGAEAVFTCEDWGTQDRLLISPALWREIFRPCLQRIFDRVHEHGMYVIMHSCGYIWEILGDLVQMGVDCMQFDAPSLMGMQRVCDLFGRKVVMFSPLDIQKVLPVRDVDFIRRSAREMIDMFAPKGGGLILKDYGDYRTIRIPGENVEAMHDEFIHYGAGLSRYYSR